MNFVKSNNENAIVSIAYENPVLFEDENTFGVSHLLEHMIYESVSDKEEEYSEHCITSNAYTSSNEVVFFIEGLSEEIENYRNNFIDRIINYKPTKEHFEKQIKIVTQEYNDAISDNTSRIYYNTLIKNYNFCSSIGTKKALDGLTFEAVENFFNNFFKPSKIIIGDKEEPSIKEYPFTFMKNENYNKLFDTYEEKKINEDCIEVTMSSKLIPVNEDSYYVPFICKMLGDGLKSPLYTEIREKQGLIYWIAANTVSVGDNSIVLIRTSTSKKNIDKVKETIYEVLNNNIKYLTKERYNICYNNLRIKTKLRAQNTVDLVDEFLESNRKELKATRNLDKISYEGMMEYYKKWFISDWVFQSQYDFV